MNKHPSNRAERRRIRKIKSEKEAQAHEARAIRRTLREREKERETQDAVHEWRLSS